VTDKPDKGKDGGSCNRQACQTPGATWYNRTMDAYYCPSCANLINRDCLRFKEEPLCAPPHP
jgi:hypothetical protein